MASETSSGIWKDSQHLLHTYRLASIPTVTHESKRITVSNFRPTAEAGGSIHSASPHSFVTSARQLDGMNNVIEKACYYLTHPIANTRHKLTCLDIAWEMPQ